MTTATTLVPMQRDLVQLGPVGSLDAYVQAVSQIPIPSASIANPAARIL